MKKYFLLLILVPLFLTGCSTDDVYQALDDTVQEQENNKFILLEDRGYADEYGVAYYIEGTVRNDTSITYSYVQVQFNVYDEAGNIIGSCLDNINNLEGNGTWKFKAICTGDANSVSSYSLTGFSSW